MSARRIQIALLMTFALLAAGSQALAQGRGRGGPFGGSTDGMRVNLLAVPQVQDALKLNDEQKTKLTKLTDDYRSQMQEIRQGLGQVSDEERQKKFAEMGEKSKAAVEQAGKVLNKEQSERLGQIVLQAQGAGALHDEKVASELKLTDDQKQRLSSIGEETRNKMRENFQNQGGQEKGQEIMKESNEKSLAVLTAEQREQFAKMQGEKIDLPPGAAFGFGGRRRQQ